MVPWKRLLACGAGFYIAVAQANGHVSCQVRSEAGTATCTIAPARDGTFTVALVAEALGDGAGPSTMRAWMELDGKPCKGGEPRDIAWREGSGRIALQCTERLTQGKAYRFAAWSTSKNAASRGMTITTRAL